MKITPIEIIGMGEHGPIYRVQCEAKQTFVCKLSKKPSMMHKISVHPNILELHHQEKQNDLWIQLFTDYPSIDVEQLLKRESSDLFGETVLYFVCAAIAHLHSAQYIHRDIKPSNIVVSEEGGVYLIDMERSVDIVHEHSIVMGNTPFLAPEVQKWSQFSKASDIYALGILAKTIISSRQHRSFQIWEKFISQCTHTDPTQRPSAEIILSSLPVPPSIKNWSQHCIPLLCAERKIFFQKIPLPKPKTISKKNRYSSWSKKTGIIFTIVFSCIGLWLSIPKPTSKFPIQASSTFTIPIISKSDLPSPIDVEQKPLLPSPKLKRGTKNETALPPEDPRIQSFRISSIPWGAQVWIDEHFIGKTLIQDIQLTTGIHMVKIEYQEKKTELSLDFRSNLSGWIWNSESGVWKELHGQ